MPMAFDEFRLALRKSLPNGEFDLPKDRDINEDYKGYLALVELMGEDGEVTLCRGKDGETKAYFRPQPGMKQ